MESEELERYKIFMECEVRLNECLAIIDRIEKKFTEINAREVGDNIIPFIRK